MNIVSLPHAPPVYATLCEHRTVSWQVQYWADPHSVTWDPVLKAKRRLQGWQLHLPICWHVSWGTREALGHGSPSVTCSQGQPSHFDVLMFLVKNLQHSIPPNCPPDWISLTNPPTWSSHISGCPDSHPSWSRCWAVWENSLVPF